MPDRARRRRNIGLLLVVGSVAALSCVWLGHGMQRRNGSAVGPAQPDVWDALVAVESSAFDYGRPWGDAFPQCNGREQSPINVPVGPDEIEAWGELFVHAHMRRGNNSLRMRHNSHGLEVVMAKHQTDLFLSRTRDGHESSLVGLHFHHPSEHTLGGRRHDLEVHFVHLNEGTNRVSVIAMLFEARDDAPFSQWLENLFGGAEPLPMSPQSPPKDVQFDSVFPIENIGQLRFVRYSGSLTTPPCSPAEWIVATKPVPVSRALLARYPTYKLNNRPIQPRNDRVLAEIRLIE